MAKKYFQKALSVGLSLTLCAGLVVPALAAANFQDLQNAVNGQGGTKIEGTNHYGYGGWQEDIGKYEIEAWDENNTRNVQLNADVTREGTQGWVGVGTNDYNRGDTLNLDLNGHTVDANGGKAAFKAESGEVTIQDNSQDKKGTIKGGTQAGVIVAKSADVTLEDVTVTGNTIGVWVAGAEEAVFTNESGIITGNDTGIVVDEDKASAAVNGGVVDNGLTVDKDATVEINGGTVSGEISVGEKSHIVINDGHTLENGAFTHQWGDWADNGDGTQTHRCELGTCHKSETEEAPVVTPDEPDEPVVVTPTEPVVDTPVEPEIEIDEPAVPLASGPITGGEFIDYLWRHEGEPEADVAGDHEYAPAISWAQSIGIIDDGFDPDELVTVSAVRSILSGFAAYSDMAMPELTTLVGDEDEAVLNCDEVLAEFFGEGQAE